MHAYRKSCCHYWYQSTGNNSNFAERRLKQWFIEANILIINGIQLPEAKVRRRKNHG
jgi:hypothetical protein